MCAGELVALAESLAVLTSALAAAMVRYDRLDAGSPAALLVRDGHLTRTEAANLRALGRKLETELPATREKLAAGELGVAQAKTIADLDTKLANTAPEVPVEARRRVEAALAAHAVAATTTETAQAALTTRYRITPGAVEQEMADQQDRRGLTLSATLDGSRHLAGLLDAETAAVWEHFLDRTSAPASPDDPRTSAARRLDAITDSLQPGRSRTQAAGEGSQESCKPYERPSTYDTGEDPATGGDGFAWRKTSPANLLIIATHGLLTGEPGAEPATFGDGTVIPAGTARRYACEAALNRVILATEKQPLELGRTTRLFTPNQVKAMIARDRTCRWKGCEVPATRCLPHHERAWSAGGTTNPGNGTMLCPTHHRMTHREHPPPSPDPPVADFGRGRAPGPGRDARRRPAA